MTVHRLLKRTTVRVAAALTTIFVLTFVTLFLILFISARTELERAIKERIVETLDTLSAIHSDSGFENLVAVGTSEAESVRDSDTILMLLDKAGAYRAGNVRNVPEFEGGRMFERPEFPDIADKGEDEDRFFARWQSLPDGRILVGVSDREVRTTQRLLLHGLISSLGVTGAIVLALGVVLARRAQRRLDDLSQTLTAVSQGSVERRVPLSGSGDDIDDIANQINRTLDHLQRLVENVNQASSDIAHDLKKPIGRLRQRLDLARRSATSVADYEAAVDSTMSELESITETFEALLRIAQIEAGSRKKRFAPLDLHAVLSDLADAYGAVVEDSGDTLAYESRVAAPAMIRGDRELLTQLFANLIENAVWHCPRPASIAIALSERDAAFCVTVSDTGPGIPPEERKNVLRRLYRLERARSTPGSGLGLSLVAAIADLHGASLSLGDNNPGLKVDLTFARL